jgi:CDP-glucose 4,6-dehydratase
MHLAAQSIVRYSYSDPVETYSTNLMGTVNLLEAVKINGGVKVVIIVTSDKCYDNKEWIWGYRETDPMGGYDPYSSSKGCAELITSAYRNSFFSTENFSEHGVAVASVRAGNVIGGGDWAIDRLIPDFFRSLISGTQLSIRNPQAVRPWQFVLEPLNGYLTLAEKLWEDGVSFSGGWNFGPKDSDCKSVSWILDLISRLQNDKLSWEIDSVDQPYESNYLKLDCSKANRYLNWSSVLDLPKALQWVTEWYQGYINDGNIRGISENQIERYEELLL